MAGKTSTTSTQNTYKNGFAYQITDTQSPNPKILWETSEVNARGQLTKAKLGNGIEINNLYDTYGYITKTKHDISSTNVNVLEFDTDFHPQRGNLNWRKNSLFGNIREEFGYDSQDRLTSYPDAQGNQVNQTYKDDGRIEANTLGTYNYSNNEKPYLNTSVSLTPEATGYYANREEIFSNDMEDKKGWNDLGLGWEIFATPDMISYDTTIFKTGTTSLKISNPTTTEKTLHSDVWTTIDNAAPTYYTYSGWVRSDGPQAEVFLMMKTETETGYTTLVNNVIINVTNQWVRFEAMFLVPANIKKLGIRLDNNGSGNVWFDDIMIRKWGISPLSTTDFSDRKLAISYNTFKSPVEISEAGVDKLSFIYNENNDRSMMFYGSLDATKTLRPLRKYYSADGSMEIKQNITTGAIEFITYLGGDGYSAPVVVKSDGITQNYLYLHRDYQGSILAITNDAGVILEKRQFDAWGEIIKVQDGAGNNLNVLTILDRGYTGHEHLQGVGLINMNGRIYDPKLHRFLQPDNYVQDPSNTQNYNRYGYCWNNPLKYTDPSGEFLTWSLSKGGFSIGFNLTPLGIPLGAGINIGWGNGASLGAYREVGYRVGGTGFGSGITISQSLDYNFKNKSLTTTTTEGAYASLGFFNAGINFSQTYDISSKQWSSGWGISVGVGIGNDASGIGFNIGYGSGGWSYGIGGYYNSKAWDSNPVYVPEEWNDNGEIQTTNNCYSYALDEGDNGNYWGLQPGEEGGQPITTSADINLDYVTSAAISDGKIKNPTLLNKLGFGKKGYYSVYLVSADGVDYHWYRQDKGGMWSHKPGITPVVNVDSSGRAISNPVRANHGIYNNGGKLLWAKRR